MELLLHLLKARGNPNAEAPPSHLQPALLGTLDLAAQHQVAPALYESLFVSVRKDSTWLAFLPFLKAIETENAKRNRKLHEGAIRIAEQLNKLEITAAFLKGAAVVLESDNYAPWRQLTDIDILVEQADVPKLTHTLLNLGYHKKYDYSDVESGLHHHYAPLYNESSNIFVEIHIRLMQDPKENPLSTIEILDQAKRTGRDGQTFLIPRPEHRMIHLIAHAQISNWGYPLRQLVLKDLVDAAELCRQHYIDWNIVQNSFARIGAPKEFMGFLCAMHIIIGMDLPFHGNEGELWAREAVHALYAPPTRVRSSARIIGQYIRLFSQNPSRLKLVWQTVSNPGQLGRLLNVTANRIRRWD